MEKEIIRLDDFGRGICIVDGKITFVDKSVVGDVVDIKLTLEKKKYNEAKIQKIVTKSKNRVEPKCPYFDICGGCNLQNISYADTVKYKTEKILRCLRNASIEADPQFVENDNPFNYRNKITLKVVDGKIGYFSALSHRIVEIKKCDIAKNCINSIIPVLNFLNIKNGEIVIRCNQNEELLIWIKTKDIKSVDVDLLKSKGKICGIVLNDLCIYGDPFLYEIINGTLYKFSYDSFFQVNPYIASKMFEIVKENISEKDIVLDLYSGVGTLSISAAKKALSVIGVEIVENAIANSLFNAKINKLNNINFVLNDANDAVKKINVPFNKLIVDPPRSGLQKNVIDIILNKLPESVIYISCDLFTLVRDLKLLKDKYKIEKMFIFDMFSYTYHVECMCVLKRR